MKRGYKILFVPLILLSLFGIQCSEENTDEPDEIIQNQDGTTESTEELQEDGNTETTVILEGEVEKLKVSEIEDSHILVNERGGNRVFLMNKDGENLFQWDLKQKLGNDSYLLPNGQLLNISKDPNAQITYGGYGGLLQLIDSDNTIAWELLYSNADKVAHHDVEMLPNGNILFLVWERIPAAEAEANGYRLPIDIYPEAIIEYDIQSEEIVWEWHSWNHIIQNYDETKLNFGMPLEQQDLVDINYSDITNGDIMHANGLSYDPEMDLIYLSVNFFSEIWVIDHSTTTEEAASNLGGNFNKGGRILYRFGNPEAYGGPTEDRLFYNNHYPNILEENRHMLLFMNGNHISESTVYEFVLPTADVISTQQNETPEIVWSFTDPTLHSQRISGAVRLRNGNTLITEGDFGLWEVNPRGEVVWKFKGPVPYWRAYNFYSDDPAIIKLSLSK
ncbi:hypothetical protein FK220_002760 [Flavobacteriaceae bacterium TP-CH-4]|uniref:Arylsulfotransferase ASST n=1 Tax=Pelagihabitans pacificus TaxID=2696054 RepID=A0A967E4C7_9FLAO|nr:aryl-sulfate sulfotransferase [Pelagihabitans pacificus]NHF58247.1 hypothetical protein [Pelagihabitans pacificus]